MIDTEPLDKLLDKMEKAGNGITTEMHKKLQKAGDKLQKKAKSLTPVDTGKLRDNIKVDVKGLTAMIGVNTSIVPYAEYVNSKIPFLDKAVDSKEAEIFKEIEQDYLDAVYNNSVIGV